jgi:hypothetical protein
MAAPAVKRRHLPMAVMSATLLTVGEIASASAQEVPPPAYQLAARRAGIPVAVLYAVALQESGMRWKGRLVPWPWSLNVAGQAQRYTNRADACAGLHRALAQVPSTRVDVGLGQINLGYQKQRYAQPCDLLDPYANLTLVADILHEQHVPGENWLMAIGRYHHPAGGEVAARYQHSVSQHLDRVLGISPTSSNVRKGTTP